MRTRHAVISFAALLAVLAAFPAGAAQAMPGRADQRARPYAAARVALPATVHPRGSGAVHTAANSDAYASLVESERPDVFYRLDETKGRVAYDSSNHHRNGAYPKGVTRKLSGPLASDPGAHAVGTSNLPDVVTASDKGLPSGHSARTLEAWVKEPVPGSGNCCSPNAALVSYGNLAAGHGFAVGLAGPFNPSIWVEQKTNGKQLSTPIPVTIYEAKNQWHLIDLTLSGKTVDYYLDGQEVGTAQLTVNTSTNKQPLTIGGWPGIADAAVYPSALSSGQIDAHWSKASSPGAAGCAPAASSAYGKLVRKDGAEVLLQLGDRGAGRVAYDASGHCHNGAYADTTTSTKGPLWSDPGEKAASQSSQATAFTSDEALPAGKSARTIEAWVMEFPQGSGHCCSPNNPIVSYGDLATGHGFAIGYNGPFNPSIWAETSTSKQVSNPAPLDVYEPVNKWHLVDVTFSDGWVTMYLDGQPVGRQKLAVNTSVAGQGLDIGDWYGIGDVAVYGTALTPQAIDSHWVAAESKTAISCSPPAQTAYGSLVRADGAAVFYPLSDRSNSRIAYDQSGHCRNGAYDDESASAPGPLPTARGLSGAESDTQAPVAIGGDEGLPSGNKAVTLEVWMQSTGDCCASGVAMSYGDVASGNGFSVGYNGGTSVFLYAEGFSGDKLQDTTPMWVRDGSLPIDLAWHLIDVTATPVAGSGVTVTMYIDGQLVDQGHLVNDTVTAGQDLAIGSASGTSIRYADAAVYPKALTPRQIDAHWTVGQTGSKTCASAGAGVYDQSVAAGGPDAFYTLEDYSASRVAQDESGHCQPGAYWDAVADSGPIATEQGASQGESAQQHVVALASGTNLPSGDSARTIEAWVNEGTGGGGGVISYGDALNGHGFAVSVNGGSIVVTGDGGSTQTFTTTTPDSIGDGNWHMLDVMYANGVVTVVVDGFWVGAGALPVDTTVPGQGLQMGDCCDEVADVAIYSGERSMGQINDDYGQSGGWTTASCGLSTVGLSGCFRTAYHWWQYSCIGIAHCTVPDRPPDFVITAASAGDGAEISESDAVSCDGNSYLSLGGGASAGPLPVSAIVGVGYVGNPGSATEPLAKSVDDFLSGSSFSFSFGAGAGEQFISSSGTEGVVYFGGLYAGVSFDETYGTPGPGNKPSPSGRCAQGATTTSTYQALVNNSAKPPSGEPQLALATTAGTPIKLKQNEKFVLIGSGFAPGSDVAVTTASKLRLGVAEADPAGKLDFLLPGFRSSGSQTVIATGMTAAGKKYTLEGAVQVAAG